MQWLFWGSVLRSSTLPAFTLSVKLLIGDVTIYPVLVLLVGSVISVSTLFVLPLLLYLYHRSSTFSLTSSFT